MFNTITTITNTNHKLKAQINHSKRTIKILEKKQILIENKINNNEKVSVKISKMLNKPERIKKNQRINLRRQDLNRKLHKFKMKITQLKLDIEKYKTTMKENKKLYDQEIAKSYRNFEIGKTLFQ